jgi:SAM-dependent methyltransferase
VFKAPIKDVCEIGTGTGGYAEKVIRHYHPVTYQSYEPDRAWSRWLAQEYRIISHETDGESLRNTKDVSIDLVLANAVFVYLPFFISMRYFKEIVRVTKLGGWAVFDIISEDCVDDENLEKWFRTGDLSHCFLGKEYVKAFFSRNGFEHIGDFLAPYHYASSHYFVFRKH